MKNMIKEKKTLLILRVVFGVLLLAGIVCSILVYRHFDARIVDDTGYADDYNPVTGTTDCTVEVELNVVVVKAQFQVAFYDETGERIDVITKNFECDGKIAYATFEVKGAVETYELLAYDITYESNTEYVLGIAIIVNVMLFALLVQSLTMSCKIYNYNGSEILVYAGFMHRYLKVDGVKVDERSTAFTYGTVNLNFMTPDGAAVLASITRMNRITLMVNNQILPEVKNAPVPAPAPATNNNTEAPANDADSTANNGDNL